MLFKLINLLFELADKIRGGILKFFRRSYIRRLEAVSTKVYSRYAIVCIYDKSPRSDLVSLFTELKKSGFGIITVSSNSADAQYAGLMDVNVRVASIGRDFFAYQQGYNVLKQLDHVDSIESVCFLNDSVWYFKRYQEELVRELIEGMDSGRLTVGSRIIDDIPHVSGWLFGIRLDEHTIAGLDQLFTINFARKSRNYNIRKGEHRIITRMASVNGIKSMDRQEKTKPYAYCYTAISKGLECFYLKADVTLRTNPADSQLEKFLEINATGNEYFEALRWITAKADALLNNPLRRAEMAQFRHHYFES